MRRSADASRPGRRACRPPPSARPRPRAPGARGGRTSRSRPSCPSAASGTPRARARGTVAGPSASAASRSSSMRSAWCSLIASTRPGTSVERMTVRGQAELHAVERADEIERREVRLQRVGVAHARDVRRDRRQHVVAGEQHARTRDPTRQRWSTVWPGVCTANHRGRRADRARRGARAAVGSGGVNSMRIARIISCACSGGPWLRRAPRRDRAPRARRRLGLRRCRRARRRVVVDRRQLVGSSSGSTSSDCASAAASTSARLRLALGERAVRARALHRPRRERVVRDQLGAGLARDAARAAEVVGVRVRDDDGVDVLAAGSPRSSAAASAPSTTADRAGRDRRR